MASRAITGISVHYRDFEDAYVYWIWLRGSASYDIIANSGTPRMNTIASRDLFKPKRIGESLVVNFKG